MQRPRLQCGIAQNTPIEPCTLAHHVHLAVRVLEWADDRQEGRMETKSRVGWMTVLVAASALVVAVFLLYLIATLVGILD